MIPMASPSSVTEDLVKERVHVRFRCQDVRLSCFRLANRSRFTKATAAQSGSASVLNIAED